MSILTKYFDKAFCVNLKRRPDRWKNSLKEFKKHGFDDIERYEAVDGKLYDWSTTTYNEDLLKGELGIMETHIKLITEAIEKGYESIAIFEDDVYFLPNVANLEEYINSVPDDWDMIYFGGNHTYGGIPVQINDKIMKLHNTFALEGVVIRKSMFHKILEVAVKREKPIDSYYADLQKINNVYGFYPNMTIQTIGYSDIQNKKVDYFNNHNLNNNSHATKNIFNNEISITKDRDNTNY